MRPILALYRVSSGEQEKAGYSIPQQRRDADSFARTHGFHIVETVEYAESAKNAKNRKAIVAVMEALDHHPEIQHVLVHRVDRWARNLRDYAMLTEERGIKLVSVREGFDDTPSGQFMQSILVAQAKYDSQLKGERVHDGMAAKAAEGWITRKAPVGYTNVPRTKTRKAHVATDPRLAPIVREVFEEYAHGDMTYADVAEALATDGVRTRSGRIFSAQMVREFLSNRFYIAKVQFNGVEYPGKHEAIVPVSLFEEVQRIRERRAKDPGEKGGKFFLLRALLWCGACGTRWTAEEHPAKRAAYYRCRRCPQPYVRTAVLDAAIVDHLRSVGTDAAQVQLLLDALDAIAHEHATRRQAEESDARRAYDDVRRQRQRVLEAFGGGQLAADDVREVLGRYDREITTLAARLDRLGEDTTAKVASLQARLRLAGGFAEAYARIAEPADRKSFLAGVIQRITIKDRCITRIEYCPPFSLLQDERAKGSREDVEATLRDQLASVRP